VTTLSSPYPIRRALPLVEAISRDFNDQLLKVLGSQKLMYMEYDTFERTMAVCQSVFNTWEEMMKEFINMARDRKQMPFSPLLRRDGIERHEADVRSLSLFA
jgi:hypothetical protein